MNDITKWESFQCRIIYAMVAVVDQNSSSIFFILALAWSGEQGLLQRGCLRSAFTEGRIESLLMGLAPKGSQTLPGGSFCR